MPNPDEVLEDAGAPDTGVVIQKVDPLAVPSRFFVIKASLNDNPKTAKDAKVVHRAVFGPVHKAEIDAYLLTHPITMNAAYLIAEDVTNG